MILIFGGTTEGRAAVNVIEEAGKPYYYSTKGDEQDIYLHHGIRLSGAMTRRTLKAFCRQNDIRLLIDAAHPFAEKLHDTVTDVAHDLGIPCIRYERIYDRSYLNPIFEDNCDPDDLPFKFEYDNRDLLRELKKEKEGHRFLFLTGVQSIARFKSLWTKKKYECYFRILDRDSSREIARQAGFPEDHLVYYHPETENLPQLLQELSPQAVVLKESGKSGGFTEKKDTILFIDPGFPVQKQQLVVMGQKYETFDVYDYRGDKLKEKLESDLRKGNISAIIYSNPNNPSWICLKEEELRIIGELATQYDVIVLEDLAYFAMDFRQDLSTPYQAPFQPSVAHYTDNYVLLISGSKAFSYAGQRIGVSCISDKLYHRSYPGLTKRYGAGTFGKVFIHRVLYALSSGTSHSAQYAMAAMLKAANEGQYNFLSEVKVYGDRAQKLKEIFLRHGFYLVYDNDLGDPIADGFYFTIGYPGMTSGELAKELMYYGVSAISLVTTGSHQEGLRACTSFIKDHQYAQLDERMKLFAEHHPIA